MSDSVMIPLTNGGVAIVDAEDAHLVSGYNWQKDKGRLGTWYATRSQRIDGKRIHVRMHRVILGLEEGDPREGDHKNHDGLDNRRSTNLRIATCSQNMTNTRKRGKGSRFKGVALRPQDGRWVAKIRATREGGPKDISLGVFDTEAEAGFAFNFAASLLRDAEYVNLPEILEDEMPLAERQVEIRDTATRKIEAVLSGGKGRLSAASAYRGVSFVKPTGKWNAMVRFEETARFMGGYRLEIEAAYAIDLALESLGITKGRRNGIKPEDLPQGSDATLIQAEVSRLITHLKHKLAQIGVT